jgi:hypothetical protein
MFKFNSGHVVTAKTLLTAVALTILLAVGAGVASGVVAARTFDTPGARGPVGLAGIDGQDGERGPRGPRGKRGAAGAAGAAGVNGADGATIVREEACSNDLDVPLPFC